MAGVTAQGASFSFRGNSYTVTSITANNGSERERAAWPHMGLGPTDSEPFVYLHRRADNFPVVDIEFIGGTIPAVGAVGAISVSGAFSVSGTATCTSSQATARAGDIFRGTASFRVQV